MKLIIKRDQDKGLLGGISFVLHKNTAGYLSLLRGGMRLSLGLFLDKDAPQLAGG